MYIAAVASALIACGNDNATLQRDEPVLIGSESATQHGIETQLSERMRELIAAVAAVDSSAIMRMVDPTVRIIDTQALDTTRAARTNAGRPAEYGYYQLLAGQLSNRFEVASPTYYALTSDRLATVYAFDVNTGFRTAWSESPDGWKVSAIVLMRPEDAQHMLEQDRNRVR
jgi:hypothetical protein